MIVQACLNGNRDPAYHPRLPVTCAAIVADAVASVAAGANELHVHPRGAEGAESLAPAVIDATIAALRARLPGTAIGVSTGDWIEPDTGRRLAQIGGWRQRPDYASVNLVEPDAPSVIAALLRDGVGVEAGLASVGDAERLVASGAGPRCLRCLIEMEQADPARALVEADAIDAVLRAAGLLRPRLLHGMNQTVWTVLRAAGERLWSMRVGLEDGATLADGTMAADNAALVAAGVSAFRTASRSRLATA